MIKQIEALLQYEEIHDSAIQRRALVHSKASLQSVWEALFNKCQISEAHEENSQDLGVLRLGY